MEIRDKLTGWNTAQQSNPWNDLWGNPVHGIEYKR